MDDIVAIIERSQEYLEKLPVVEPMAPLPDGLAIAGWIDHTLLKPEATALQVKTLCQEAIEHHFAAVCVNPVFAPLVSGLLKDTKIATCCVVGFPLGANAASMKMAETISCIAAW
jgi:deoxyribose-phosphate aldolase